MLEHFTRSSQWHPLKKVGAWLLRVKTYRNRSQLNPVVGPRKRKGPSKPQPILVEELQRAEVVILRIMQAESFPSEINALKMVKETNERSFCKRKKMELKKSSSLYHLDPFSGPDGLLREEISTEMKHPIILPKKSRIIISKRML